jgi:hypothetical protein
VTGGSALHCCWLLLLPGPLPWAVFEVASGTLLLRQELLQALASSPAQASAVLVNACTAALQHLLQHLKVRLASQCKLLQQPILSRCVSCVCT